MKKGFTLIELLVVVLIVGILSAVALPQYQTSVEKARASEAFVLLKAIKTGAEVYWLANGKDATPTILDLDIDLPGEDIMLGVNPAKKTKNLVLYFHPNGNPHANEINGKWTLGYGSQRYFCHSKGDKYEHICKALGGKLVAGDCSNGDGRHCYSLQ